MDSLSRSIDSLAKTSKSWQDSFTKVQDSIYQAAIEGNLRHQSSQKNVAEQKKHKATLRLWIILSICFGTVIIFVSVLLRRKKAKN